MSRILLGIDFLGVYMLEHKRYSAKHGSFYWNGKSTPRTTLREVRRLADYFRLYADPGHAGCVSLVEKHQPKHAGRASSICKADGLLDDHVDKLRNPRNFVKTKGWSRAKAAFEETTPSWWDAIAGDQDAEYPKNGEFWDAAQKWMIERSAAQEVPTTMEMVQDSIYETIQDRGDDLSSLNPFSKMPDLGPYAEVAKWATVAGGLYVLYKVLEPKKS